MPKPFYSNPGKVQEIIRVNHAGEFGAQRIYQGQIDFCKNDQDKKILQKMLEQELEHLEYFEQKIRLKDSKPTLFLPLWSKLGYALGAISSIAGRKTTMLVTEAVEEVIVDHYSKQIEYLEQTNTSPELLKKIQKFKKEEAEHIHIATEQGSRQAPFYKIISFLVDFACKKAILISKKI